MKSSVFPLSDFQKLLGLHGKDYEPYAKALYLCLVGHALRYNYIMDWTLDTRFPITVILPADHGKGHFIDIIKLTCDVLPLRNPNRGGHPSVLPLDNSHEIVSVARRPHPEGLVGKVEKLANTDKKNDGVPFTYHTTIGELGNDFLVMNDALPLVKRDDDIQADMRERLLTALDPMVNEKNRIEKTQVNVPYEERLSYSPVCTVSIFIQPDAVDPAIVKTGFFRRTWPAYYPINEDDRLLGLGKRVPRDQALVKKWQEFIQVVAGGPGQYGTGWTIGDDVKEAVSALAREFSEMEVCTRWVQERFFHDYLYTLSNNFLKIACINAGSRLSTKVEMQDVQDMKEELMDLMEGMAMYVGFYVPDAAYSKMPIGSARALVLAKPGMRYGEWIRRASAFHNLKPELVHGWGHLFQDLGLMHVEADEDFELSEEQQKSDDFTLKQDRFIITVCVKPM